MIIFKKATIHDVKKVAIGIMQLKDSPENLTDVEVMEFINHCYYAEDQESGSIVAIVAAVRELVKYHDENDIGSPGNMYANRYMIKYILGDDYAINELNRPQTLTDVFVYLIRELVNDMNDWSVWVDTDVVYDDTDTTYNHVVYTALRTNDFVSHSNRPNILIRAMAIDFNALH